jgi:Ca-activated chloride channel family protein
MSFLAPIAFAFAAAIPVVIVFYLLKRKRTVKLISSTLLWQKFLAETQANAPFQRLRHNWLLLLQILMLLLAVFALARPYVTGTARSSRLRVLILDASASMQATDEKPSRFEKARAEALKWVDGLRDGDQMVILLAGGNTEVKQSATTDKSALRRALQSARPTDSPTRLLEAFQLAETLLKNQSDRDNPEIHLFSDGAIRDIEEIANRNLPLVYHRIGQTGNNLGIGSIDVRANPDDAAQRALFASIVNPMPSEQQVNVELRFGDDLIETRPVMVPATNTLPLAFVADQARDGIFTVRLDHKDDLAADNQASIVSILPRPVKALLVTRGNRILEKVLRAVPGVQLSTAPELVDEVRGYDVVVLDGITPAVWPRANVLAIHVAPTNLFAEVTMVDLPPIVDWKSTHPLLRSVGSLNDVAVFKSLGVKRPNWGVTIVESPQSPLIIAGEIDRRRIVWIGFDPLESRWPYSLSFPIFFQNSMDWLNPASGNAGYLTVKAGEPFRLALPDVSGAAQVIKPDGEVTSIATEKNAGGIIFGDTTRQGIYRVRAGTNEIAFTVNLMDAAETDIRPRDELPIGEFGAGIAATQLQRANSEIWRWVALGALAVLLFEWWWYHRRTA